MLQCHWAKYHLDFTFEAVTSRERMWHRDTYYIKVSDGTRTGIGEASLFRGLSRDDRPGFEDMLAEVAACPQRYVADLSLLADWPSIRMGLETAVADLESGGEMKPFCSELKPIRINGLIWMGDKAEMTRRFEEKLSEGFSCIKLKVGGIAPSEEEEILRMIRSMAPDAEIRLDANGAFAPGEALARLERLARYGIHSIEQPIRQGQTKALAEICSRSPIPVALDEELINIGGDSEGMRRMLDEVRPAFVVIKPTLVGGFSVTRQWIDAAAVYGAGWWVTSALESNVGLNAIARWLSANYSDLPMAQGLGTGQIYANNITSPLRRTGQWLTEEPGAEWRFPDLDWK